LAHLYNEATYQGQVAMGAYLARPPQAGAHHHRQCHPHNAALGFDAEFVSLDLPQVTRLLDQMFLHGLTVVSGACQSAGHRPLNEPKGTRLRGISSQLLSRMAI
jgi:hypothetical protein